MPRLVDILIEVDPQAPSGYTLCCGDGYREDFCSPESRTRFKPVTSFRFVGAHGDMLARKYVRNRIYAYWYGFKRFKRRVHKVYLGEHDRMTIQRLEDGVVKLHSRLGNVPWDIVPGSGQRVGNMVKPMSSDQLDLR